MIEQKTLNKKYSLFVEFDEKITKSLQRDPETKEIIDHGQILIDQIYHQ